MGIVAPSVNALHYFFASSLGHLPHRPGARDRAACDGFRQTARLSGTYFVAPRSSSIRIIQRKTQYATHCYDGPRCCRDINGGDGATSKPRCEYTRGKHLTVRPILSASSGREQFHGRAGQVADRIKRLHQRQRAAKRRSGRVARQSYEGQQGCQRESRFPGQCDCAVAIAHQTPEFRRSL